MRTKSEGYEEQEQSSIDHGCSAGQVPVHPSKNRCVVARDNGKQEKSQAQEQKHLPLDPQQLDLPKVHRRPWKQ